MQPCPPAGQRFNWRNVFPTQGCFSHTHPERKTLWPGKLVRILGGFAIPDNIMELKAFFDEMEFLLMKNCIVHFFPEGELRPYDTGLQNFKKGHFILRHRLKCQLSLC